MGQTTYRLQAKWRKDVGNELVLVSVTDATWLWNHGFYGLSPERDVRKTPVYGTLSLCEAYYLLLKTERQEPDKGDGRMFTFSLQDAENKALFYSSKDLFLVFWSEGEAASCCRMLAYARLRDLGWIVRYGLNYGADFLLYRGNPESEHATFAVVVKGLSRDENDVERELIDGLTWQQAVGLSRVATTARKRLVIAYVTIMGEHDVEGQYSCKFLQISRWNLGTKARDDDDD